MVLFLLSSAPSKADRTNIKCFATFTLWHWETDNTNTTCFATLPLRHLKTDNTNTNTALHHFWHWKADNTNTNTALQHLHFSIGRLITLILLCNTFT